MASWFQGVRFEAYLTFSLLLSFSGRLFAPSIRKNIALGKSNFVNKQRDVLQTDYGSDFPEWIHLWENVGMQFSFSIDFLDFSD